MENMDEGLTIPKQVLINWQKSAQIVNSRSKNWGFQWKKAALGVLSPWKVRFTDDSLSLPPSLTGGFFMISFKLYINLSRSMADRLLRLTNCNKGAIYLVCMLEIVQEFSWELAMKPHVDLKVKKSCNDFFKSRILPTNKQMNSCFFAVKSSYSRVPN